MLKSFSELLAHKCKSCSNEKPELFLFCMNTVFWGIHPLVLHLVSQVTKSWKYCTESGSRVALGLDNWIFVDRGEIKNHFKSRDDDRIKTFLLYSMSEDQKFGPGIMLSQDSRTAFITGNWLECSAYTWLLAETVALRDLINNQVKQKGNKCHIPLSLFQNWFKLFSPLKDNLRK